MTYPAAHYHGDSGEVSARFRESAQPPEVEIGTGAKASFLATGASTRGQFGLYRWDIGPEPGGAGTHFHRSISESFFVLSGTVQLFNGERWTRAGAGDFLYVPEGGLTAFRNESGEPASMLILFAPGAPREEYFETLAELAATSRQMSEEERAEFFIAHDTYWP